MTVEVRGLIHWAAYALGRPLAKRALAWLHG
jgi:hypothetical protein